MYYLKVLTESPVQDEEHETREDFFFDFGSGKDKSTDTVSV